MTEKNAGRERRENPLETWNGIFREISSISKAAGVPPIGINFSTDVKDFGRGKYFMRVRTLFQFDQYEPDVIAAFLFLKPEEEGKDGDLIEISMARANWIGGMPDTYVASTVPIDPVALCPLDGYDMVDAAKQVVADDSVGMLRSILPPRFQTDLSS